LNKSELLSLQSFPTNYRFPDNYSLTKIASLLGNSINLTALQHFLKDKFSFNNLKFVDLFSGIGAFHLAVKELGKASGLPGAFLNKCVLALDINKSCVEVYQLNFPTTPFLKGDINQKEIQQQIIETDFDLLCAGFPCQPYSKAGQAQGTSPELTNLSTIIKKKQPNYLLFENVPNFLLYESSKFLLPLLTNYQLQMAVINPKDLGIKQNRPRLFI